MKDRELYSIEDARFLLGGIAREDHLRSLNDGQLASVVIGRRRFIPAAAITAFIATTTTNAAPSQRRASGRRRPVQISLQLEPPPPKPGRTSHPDARDARRGPQTRNLGSHAPCQDQGRICAAASGHRERLALSAPLTRPEDPGSHCAFAGTTACRKFCRGTFASSRSPQLFSGRTAHRARRFSRRLPDEGQRAPRRKHREGHVTSGARPHSSTASPQVPPCPAPSRGSITISFRDSRRPAPRSSSNPRRRPLKRLPNLQSLIHRLLALSDRPTAADLARVASRSSKAATSCTRCEPIPLRVAGSALW